VGDDTSDFQQRLLDALNEAKLAGLFAGIPGLVDVGDFTVTQDDGSISGIQNGQNNDTRGLAVGTVAAIAAAGAVGLVAVILILMRRRSRYSDGKHAFFDDDSRYLDTDIASDEQGTPRRVHIVGEADSIVSEWPSFEMPNDSFGDGDVLSDLRRFERGMFTSSPLIDVHKCSSATCEICQAKQVRPSFVPLGKAPRAPPRIPVGAKRPYATFDTVQL
jgi:hypothetical protein